MLHENPVLIAFAVSLRSTSTKLTSAHAHRTISPAAASTSSSNDSAIGTTSPSSAASVSPSSVQDHQQILQIAYAVQDENSNQKAQIYELNIADLDTDIAEVSLQTLKNNFL